MRGSSGKGRGGVRKVGGGEEIQQGSDGDVGRQEHPQLFLCHGCVSAAANERKSSMTIVHPSSKISEAREYETQEFTLPH